MFRLTGLPAMLGFCETLDMLALRREVIAAFKAGTNGAQLLSAYEQYSMDLVKSLSGEYYAHAQVGRIVQKALIWQEAGRLLFCLQELDYAKVYAFGMCLDDIVELLEIDIKLVNIEISNAIRSSCQGCLSRSEIEAALQLDFPWPKIIGYIMALICNVGQTVPAALVELGSFQADV